MFRFVFLWGAKGLFVTLTSKYLKYIISDANFNVQQLNRTKTFIFGESKILLLEITRVYVNWPQLHCTVLCGTRCYFKSIIAFYIEFSSLQRTGSARKLSPLHRQSKQINEYQSVIVMWSIRLLEFVTAQLVVV